MRILQKASQTIHSAPRNFHTDPIDTLVRNFPLHFNSTFRMYSAPHPVLCHDNRAGLRLCRGVRRSNEWSND
jgi:hypothetical protein